MYLPKDAFDKFCEKYKQSIHRTQLFFFASERPKYLYETYNRVKGDTKKWERWKCGIKAMAALFHNSGTPEIQYLINTKPIQVESYLNMVFGRYPNTAPPMDEILNEFGMVIQLLRHPE